MFRVKISAEHDTVNELKRELSRRESAAAVAAAAAAIPVAPAPAPEEDTAMAAEKEAAERQLELLRGRVAELEKCNHELTEQMVYHEQALKALRSERGILLQ